MFGKVGLFLGCVCLVWRNPSVASGHTADEEWDGVTLVQGAHYQRSTNWTSICLHNPFTRCFVHLVGDDLAPVYPWVDVSDMAPERELARVQRAALMEMVDAYPSNDTFSFEVTVFDSMMMVTLSIDESSVTWDLDDETVEGEEGIAANDLESYRKTENLTAFLESRNAVLGRWRNLSETAHEMDRAGTANVTFLYHANTSVFECSVAALVPVYFSINLSCDGSPMGDRAIVGWQESDEAAVQAMSWTDPRCDVNNAECTVESTNEWKKVLRPTIVGKIATEAMRASDVGSDVVVSLLVVALILVAGLVVSGIYWYKASGRTRRGWASGYRREFI